MDDKDDVKKMKRYLRLFSFPADEKLASIADVEMWEATSYTIDIVDKMRDVLPETIVTVGGIDTRLLFTDFTWVDGNKLELWFTSTGTRFGPSVQFSCILPGVELNHTIFDFLEALWNFVGSAEFNKIAQDRAAYLPF
jgi:hypothetical protein